MKANARFSKLDEMKKITASIFTRNARGNSSDCWKITPDANLNMHIRIKKL